MNMMNMNMMNSIGDTVMSKLRNTVTTVTSTVSQLSAVLPGNPVTREFEVTAHVASGGPGLMWKIYSAYKKSTKQEAAVFLFEKKQLDKWSRRDRDNMIELMRKGVNQLTRLKHPRVLTVQHPLEESRDSLAFATEPIFASLANVLGEWSNMPEEGEYLNIVKEYKLQEIEIKYGLLQICEALTFLNNDAKILHGNVSPEGVIITKHNSWKISGLEFSLQGTSSNGGGSSEVTWPSRSYDNDAHPLTQPCLDYLAPEITSSMSCSPASEMFSLGMLTYTCYNKGRPMFQNRGDWNRHRQNIIVYNQLPDSKLLDIPPELKLFIRRLLNFDPQERPDSHEFSKLEYFHDEGVNTLSYLDSLFQWDNLQKSKFYKGLAEILPGLPHRVRLLRVVPCLAQEFVNPSMVPFVLPNVLKIAEWSTSEEYVAHILPYLKDVMKLREPVQVLFIFMKYMEMLLQKTPADVTKSDVLPLIYGSLESDSPQVQELCLSIIPGFAGLIDYPAMKNSLLPRIRKLVISTSSLSVRVNCLVCLGKILDNLDKWMVIDYILPFLTEIPSRDPAVIMGVVGIYKLAVNHKKLGVTKEIIATRILPFIFPLTIENGLTTQQFQTIMGFIYEMIKMVETEHRSKLEELGAIAKEREQMKTEMNNHPIFQNDASSKTKDIFDDFTLPSSSSSSTKNPSLPNSNTMPLIPGPPGETQSSNFTTHTPPASRANTTMKNDLMSSLLNSNLNKIGSTSGTQHSQQQQGMTTSMSMPMGLGGGRGNMNVNMNGGGTPPMMMNRSPTMINPTSMINPPPPGGMQYRGVPFQQQQQMRPLAPPPNQLIMGGVAPPRQPMLQPNLMSLTSSGQKNSVKSLSKSDIDDLLS